MGVGEGGAEGRLTRARRDTLQVNAQRHIVLGLGLRLGQNVPGVLLLEGLARAVLGKVGPALDRHGEEDDGLGVWRRDVEAHAVKVDELDVGARRPRSQ